MNTNMSQISYVSYNDAIGLLKTEKWSPIDNVVAEPQKCLGMIADSDVLCGNYVPEYNRSAVDGYATESGLTVEASESKPVKIGTILPDGNDGRCTLISTGEILPEGTDSVIMLEDTVMTKSDIFALKTLRHWENVSLRGEDLKPDSIVIHRGKGVKPENISAALACRINSVSVYRKFSLSLLSTGDEIVSGRVPNYTQPLLSTFFSMPFIQTVEEGTVGDSFEMIKDRVIHALKSSDALIVTGGSGPGIRDLVPGVLKTLGHVIFRGVKIKPGRTVSAFNVGGKLVLSVSGLPVAALVSTEAILWPFLELMIGYKRDPLTIKARMNGTINADPGIRTYVRVKLSADEDGYLCTPLKVSGSGVLSTLLDSTGTVTIMENTEGINNGETVTVELNGVV
ncbi:putative molybdopterin biosynthesis protein MoeA/LysR substrate binding-domain-containing protein [Thermoplasmatales archaeon]|nr:putative molybdopterin biosynthesis protein MoeA/LysR substrate binding-domain-containing protein [Thermoplasmatales archaeon]